MEFLYKSAPIGDQIVDFDEKNNIVKGYGSYFDNQDSDKDIIRPGAYQKTIQEKPKVFQRNPLYQKPEAGLVEVAVQNGQ